jgi:pimeloyl-ACP methyl ester carboxylesterase
MNTLPLPLYFGPTDAPRFGCLHGSDIRGARLAVVICSPFGREEVSAHRSLKFLAGAIAELGMPVLRFDMAGCGDSAGDDLDPDRLAHWVASVRDAIDAIRRVTGVSQVALVGLRLGTLLATLAAQHREDVAALVALVPVTRGRSFVRELTALARASANEGNAAGGAPEPSGQPIEAGGFLMTQETCDALSAVDLAVLPAPARHVLIVERDDLAGSPRWSEALRGAGVAVETCELPGYTAMMLDPHATRIPIEMVTRVAQWLTTLNHDLAATLASPDATPATQPAVTQGHFPSASAHASLVSEQAVWIDKRLFGILSLPANPPAGEAGATPRRAVLLLNAGATRHVGPNRLHVPLARAWASHGLTVLRMDIAGLGESPAPPGCDDNIVYSPHASHDLRCALDWLDAATGGAPCTVVGLCSGAYHAFKAAAAGDKLHGIVAINPLTFFWKEGMPLDPPMPAHRIIGEAARYQRAALDPARWLKLLKGQVNLGRAAQVLIMRANQKLQSRWREVARRLGRPLRDDLGAELDTAIRHAIRLQFVFAVDDPGGPLLWTQGGSVARRLAQSHQLSAITLERADHTFTRLDARKRLIAVLDELVLR